MKFKTTLSVLIFFLITILTSKNAIASHAYGASISYQDLGNNQYKIRYILFRDCSGVISPGAVDIQYYSSCFPTVQTIVLSTLTVTPEEITPVCPSAVTTCRGGTIAGIEKWIYEGVITLSDTCTDWTFSHSENYRSDDITTIAGVGNDNLYVETIMNNTVHNNSVILTENPTTISCVGKSTCIRQYAFDAEGDSLVFQQITPRTGRYLSDTVSYISGFSRFRPLTAIPITFDSQTGDLCFTPAVANEITPIAIRVNEYRNGILVGSSIHDMELTVVVCTNNFPAAYGFNGSPTDSMSICSNQQNCFYISAVDQDLSDTTSVSWDNSLLFATYNNTSGRRDTLTICWTPTDADTISNPHCFYVNVTDDACPYLGTEVRQYCLYVLPSIGCTLSTPEIDSQNSFLLYPQPATNSLTIQIDKFIPGSFVVIYSLLGNVIAKIPVTENKMIFDTYDIQNGLYAIALVSNNGVTLSAKQLVILK